MSLRCRVIHAATNKSKTFNRFVQWVLFGGEGLMAENNRRASSTSLVGEGHVFDDDTLSRLSPYITEHVNRFGTYTLDFDRGAVAQDYALSPLPKLAGAE